MSATLEFLCRNHPLRPATPNGLCQECSGDAPRPDSSTMDARACGNRMAQLVCELVELTERRREVNYEMDRLHERLRDLGTTRKCDCKPGEGCPTCTDFE
jgi:hypothetical protein